MALTAVLVVALTAVLVVMLTEFFVVSVTAEFRSLLIAKGVVILAAAFTTVGIGGGSRRDRDNRYVDGVCTADLRNRPLLCTVRRRAGDAVITSVTGGKGERRRGGALQVAQRQTLAPHSPTSHCRLKPHTRRASVSRASKPSHSHCLALPPPPAQLRSRKGSLARSSPCVPMTALTEEGKVYDIEQYYSVTNVSASRPTDYYILLRIANYDKNNLRCNGGHRARANGCHLMNVDIITWLLELGPDNPKQCCRPL
ncbi:Protein of unknown function [Gryllus bimaculatus]|nr:Protein of unknown function [Gryllus bimaculatus]